MTPALRVVAPGLLTTVQDGGRPHAIPSGVQPGGAMDRFAYLAANLLVGNDRSAATLECTIRGPRLVAERRCLVAITGGDLDPKVNGASTPMWTGIELAEGDELDFGTRLEGARAYLAIAGGIVADRWLGSMSTNLMVQRGGMHGRPLEQDDVIIAADTLGGVAPGLSLAEPQRPVYSERTLRFVAGPQAARLPSESRETLLTATFHVSPDSNRMGYRLEGAKLQAPGEEVLSFALIAGAVQLPTNGRPILLMADHQTAGGYPVIAVVVSASLPIAAQLAPGDDVRFAEISIDDALRLRAAQREALDSLTS